MCVTLELPGSVISPLMSLCLHPECASTSCIVAVSLLVRHSSERQEFSAAKIGLQHYSSGR